MVPRLAALDNLIFLILVAVAGLFKWLASRNSGGSNDDSNDTTPSPPRRITPIDRSGGDSDAERIRKFLEALGQPPGSAPPKPVQRREETPQPLPTEVQRRPPPAAEPVWKRNILNPLPPLTTAPPRRRVTTPRQVQPASPPIPMAEPAPARAEKETELVRVFEAHATDAYAIKPAATPAVASRSDLTDLFSSPEALRRAIILREIFGPPRSLEPIGEPGLSGQLL